jgi:hypothetical protein
MVRIAFNILTVRALKSVRSVRKAMGVKGFVKIFLRDNVYQRRMVEPGHP